MSNSNTNSFLDQARAAASSAYNTASNLAAQATEAAQPHVQNLSSAIQSGAQQAAPVLQNLASQTASTASNLATQAQSAASAALPSVVPAPSKKAGDLEAGVDRSHDLKPEGAGTAQLDQFLGSRPSPAELQEKNILKGSPDDTLAGKKADLARAQIGDRLDGELANRPKPSELVKEGILNPDEDPTKA